MAKGNPNPISRTGKTDIAPAIRNSFFKGFKKYCRKHNMTFSDAFAKLIEDEGLLPVLDRVSKFTVRESQVTGTIDHKHSLEGVLNEIAAERATKTVTDGRNNPVLEVKPRLVRSGGSES